MRTVLAVVVLWLLVAAPAAQAVWGGQEDTSHPGMGAMYFDEDGDGAVTPDFQVCTGSFFTFDGVRRSGTSTVIGLTRSSLQFNQNRNGVGTGSGVCFGDSGSPQLEQGTLRLLSVTNGGNGQCNANDANYRVDTPAARAFLGQFLALP